MTDEQRDIERQAGQIIWKAASLTPGVPGHASRTAVLVAEMCALIREVHAAAHQEELSRSPTGRIGQPEPPKLQQLHPPGVDQAELQRLREKYAPPGRAH